MFTPEHFFFSTLKTLSNMFRILFKLFPSYTYIHCLSRRVAQYVPCSLNSKFSISKLTFSLSFWQFWTQYTSVQWFYTLKMKYTRLDSYSNFKNVYFEFVVNFHHMRLLMYWYWYQNSYVEIIYICIICIICMYFPKVSQWCDFKNYLTL